MSLSGSRSLDPVSTAITASIPSRGNRDGQVVHHAAVDAEPAADLARRVKPGQRARRVHRVDHAHITQAGQSPHDLRAALKSTVLTSRVVSSSVGYSHSLRLDLLANANIQQSRYAFAREYGRPSTRISGCLGTAGLRDVNVLDAVYASCALPGFLSAGRSRRSDLR